MMNRRLLAAVVAAAGLLGVPAGASAAVTLGSTEPTTVADPAPGVSTERTIVQTGGGNYVVPAGDWVATKVAARLLSGQFGTAAVRFARPQNGNYLFLRTEPLPVTETATPKVFEATASSQLKLKGGDLIGITFGGAAQAYSDNTTGFTWASVEDDPIDGSEASLTPNTDPLLDGPYAISATLEPDADADGYGDETQDACPQDAEKQEAPCATDLKITQALAATTILSGTDLGTTIIVSNLGPAKAINVRVTATYGQSLFHKTYPVFCEHLVSHGEGTFCTLGDIEPGQTVLISGVIGSYVVKSDVSEAHGVDVVSDNRDLDKDNNKTPSPIITIKANTGGGPGTTPPPPPGTCRAPKLKGKTLAQAKKLIRTAKCALGKVTKPKRKLKKGYRLVVKTQRPAVGAVVPQGTKINLTMKAAKKKR